ncbi:GntR family transcriptional regulator [Hoeflea halophila]|uniref:GntR family transcriptional regulator n=1 Tax=Hoeflea halophila TaxID=714899 RepID=A0A286IAV6_9HYPH|nr:GntR family transcriptional regulator [Hoeflea halophila]SOE16756.1 GntR family transcriptional regulator [Hoeflea halophila]
MSLEEPVPAQLPEVKRKRGQGVGAVFETLKHEILNLTLEPGSPIDEVKLAERFGISRTPIREAMVKLAGEGLVVTLPNRFTIVAPIDFANLPQFFDALSLMYRVTTRLAAANRTENELAAIRELQHTYTAAVEASDVPAMIEVNRNFHAAIARAGKNRYYTDLFVRLLDEGRRLLRLYYSSYNDKLPRIYLQEHEVMLAAIEAQDIEAADRIAEAHAEQIVRQIQNAMTEDRRLNAGISL